MLKYVLLAELGLAGGFLWAFPEVMDSYFAVETFGAIAVITIGVVLAFEFDL